MSRHITLWDKVGNEIAFIVVGDVVANTERVTKSELLALADVPNLRIEEYEEHRNDRPQRYVNTMQDYDRIGREDWDD